MSFVRTLIIETETIKEPTREDIENAICVLDAERHTLVILAPPAPEGPPDGDQHMAIGGRDEPSGTLSHDDPLHPYAISSAGTDSFGYDAVGNQMRL